MTIHLVIALLAVFAGFAIVELAHAKPRIGIGQPAFYSARCHSAYTAVRWYRAKYDEHRKILGLSFAPRLETGMDCARLRKRAAYWVHAAKVNRLAVKRSRHVLRNHKGWPAAVHEVQKAFPGTEGWLLSCSAAEGGHGRWVRYGGGAYYPGYEHTDQVGNWLQYRWSTFRGHYRRGLDSLRSRGFQVELPPPTDVQAWLSPLGTAVAGGWARWSGNDNAHWSASWNNGC